MNRTIDDIEAEERQLQDQQIDLDVQIKNYPYPESFDKAAELNGVYPAGHKTLRMLRNDQEAIEVKLLLLDEEKQAMIAQGLQSSSTLRKPAYGELKKIVNMLVERDGSKGNETVPSSRINLWIREYADLGIELKAGSIRRKLTDLGCTIEKGVDDEPDEELEE